MDENSPFLEQALTHPSFANEKPNVADNQRLEFLGDAVLGFCTSQLLFERFPNADEGALTRMRAQLVSAEALSRWAVGEHLAEALRLGKGAEAGGLKHSRNVLADAAEALIAATFLEAGMEKACEICEKIIDFGLESLESAGARDPKSELQERAQAEGIQPPCYEVRDSGGPPHARWFEIEVRLAGVVVGRGRGRSKRAAERAAAASALRGAAFEPGVSTTSRRSE